ncbi:hypothetical protein L3X38_029778 [Prunus dulcis]|uniref:Uncharacterized protein n=1 Tax=Prunus dulcis TaxID=3755 RepID=A0AAD4VS91_PRUDU|nr:hypothetical protein L3X38_029778 [Prunus dulcis]
MVSDLGCDGLGKRESGLFADGGCEVIWLFAGDDCYGFNDIVGTMRRWPEVIYSTMAVAVNFQICCLRWFPGAGGGAGPVGQRFWSWWDSSGHAQWLRWLALEEDSGWQKLGCRLDYGWQRVGSILRTTPNLLGVFYRQPFFFLWSEAFKGVIRTAMKYYASPLQILASDQSLVLNIPQPKLGLSTSSPLD